VAGELDGGVVDLKIVVATRNVHDATLSGLRRAPPPMPTFLRTEWHYLWEMRVLRDHLVTLDSELRSLHAASWTSIDWTRMHADPLGTGEKLGQFLGVEVRAALPSQAFLPYARLRNLPQVVRYFAPVSEQFSQPDATALLTPVPSVQGIPYVQSLGDA